ncbi:hypothetical protein [Bacillus cereus]|uniref:hypothetical protein n=1 Tax=Bacillus cereus TaxID=1396 RepID=UPI003C2E3F0B
MLKVSTSTVNKILKGGFKRANIETPAKVANHFEINDIRELFEIIKEDKVNTE